MNTKFTPDWDSIKEKKQNLINQNNIKENAKRIPHQYKLGDRVLLKTDSNRKYGKDPYEGPCVILQVNDNGTIKYQKKNLIDTINIRQVHPYKE